MGLFRQSVFIIIIGLLASPLYRFIWLVRDIFYQGPVEVIGVDKCKRIDVDGCEKIVINHRTNIAYLSCARDVSTRQEWFPPILKFSGGVQKPDIIYAYDLETEEFTPLEFPATFTEYTSHGIAIWDPLSVAPPPHLSFSTLPTNPQTLTLFAVNHLHAGSVIEIFELPFNTTQLVHITTVQSELLTCPNDLIALGPREFMVTNMLRFTDRWLSQIEIFLTLKITNVLVYSPGSNAGENTLRVVASGLNTANGIAISNDFTQVYVASTWTRGIYAFTRPQKDILTLERFIHIGFLVDNISVDEKTDELYVAVIPNPKEFWEVEKDIKNNKASSQVRKINLNDGSHVAVISDTGEKLSVVTSGARSAQKGLVLVGSVLAEGTWRCEV